MDKTELIKNHIRYYKTLEGEHRGVALHFVNEIEMNEFLQQYATKVIRERDKEWMKHLLKWGDRPAKFCPTLPKNQSNQEESNG